MKGAHVNLASAAWQEIGVKPFFGLSGINALDLPRLIGRAALRKSNSLNELDFKSYSTRCDSVGTANAATLEESSFAACKLVIRQSSKKTHLAKLAYATEERR
jgi:hypothetical protein